MEDLFVHRKSRKEREREYIKKKKTKRTKKNPVLMSPTLFKLLMYFTFMNNLVTGTNNVRFLSSFSRREETVFHCISLHTIYAAAFTGGHTIFHLFIYYLLCFIITRILLRELVKEQDSNREHSGLWRKSWKTVQLAPASRSHVLKLKHSWLV